LWKYKRNRGKKLKKREKSPPPKTKKSDNNVKTSMKRKDEDPKNFSVALTVSG
jgi:hypothetical protein